MTSSPRLNWSAHDGEGPVCLMIHGALASRSYWNENVSALSEVCRPVSIELWGHGRSPSPEDPEVYTPEGYIDQFERICEELDVDQVYLVGQSMGAALMLHYALARPERALALVLTNSSSAFANPAMWEHRHATIVTELAREVRSEGVEVLRESWINPSRSMRIPESTRRAMVKEFGEHQTEGIARSLEVTNRSLPLGDRLESVAPPTMLTVGVLEEGFLPLVEKARRIPGIEIVDIEAAHAVNAQNPQQWNDAVVEFLRRHSPTVAQ
ncbi:MAG: alpha/beta hydrolase [Actinomycetota bacterium]|nr:alpha/beta hydrolase [Actinomycetota bacterium]